MKEDFAILGDLGEQPKGGRKYIVRMWSGAYTIDEEFEAPTPQDLLKQINDRLSGITPAQARKEGTKVPKMEAKDWSGHAIPITEEQGLGYEGRVT